MALNKYMHQRNIYKHKKPNFKELAKQFDFFDAVAEKDECGRVQLDFRVPSHLAALSKALLMKDFNLNVDFPGDRLIPTVPLRLNYILWLEDLLKGFQRFSEPIKILDIGVGASCIYPLLGSRKNSWKFFGTESDMRNFSLAKENVDKNNLSEDIKLFHVAENASSLDLIFRSNGENESKNTTYLHAVMANPPFFSDASDAVGSNTCRSLNRPPPKTVSSAARHESQTTGGEVYFCMRLIRESLRYSTRVGVFTIMLGKKSSVPLIRRIMNKLKITQMSVYEMCQGRIMRWGVAWTFLPNFPFPESDFRRLRKMERPPLTYQLPNPVSCLRDNTVEALLDWLRCEFKQLGMKVLDQKNRAELGGVHLNITATVNTWTHVRRKRREAQRLLISNQIDAKNNGNSTNNGCNSTEEPMEVGVVIDVNPKNPLKRIHHNDSFEMESISTSTLQTTTTEMGTDISVIEIANQSKRIRKLTHAEICEEGEDAWDNGDEHDYNDNNNTCSSKMLSTPSSTDACTHLIQANVFVEYLNTDSFQTNELISSSMSTSCLFPNGINNNDYGDNIQKNEKSRQDASDNGNDHVTDNATAVDDDDSDDDDDVILQEDHGPLVIKIAWVNGTCREAANQILCYLKNRLK